MRSNRPLPNKVRRFNGPKKAFLLLLISVIATGGYLLHDSIYYRDKVAFISPLGGETLRLRYDEYGEGHYGAKRRGGRTHKGVDVLADKGAPVRAAKSGWAVSRLDLDGYGNYVVIRHRGGYSTRYGHLEAASMRWIRKVRQGDTIGWVGCSGNARHSGIKAHLHFEIRKNGIAIDPALCLAVPIRQ